MSNTTTITEQRRKNAIDNVIRSLELSHVNFDSNNPEELAVIKEGMSLLEFVGEYVNLPLWV